MHIPGFFFFKNNFMKLVDQVCTLEQAIKLKQLGVAQQSLWYYDHYVNNGLVLRIEDAVIRPWGDSEENYFKDGIPERMSSAFTGSELRLLLPSYFEDANGDKYKLHEWFGEYGSIVMGIEFREYEGYNSRYDDIYRTLGENRYPKVLIAQRTEAMARANLLIHILEDQKFSCVKIAECNERLTK